MTTFSEFLKNERKKRDDKLISEIDDLKEKIDKIKPIVDEYYELSRIYNQKKKDFDNLKEKETFFRLKKDTKYEECEFPKMGKMGFNGSVKFQNQEQAELLLESLRKDSNYRYAYILKWEGNGEYIIEPDWKYDRDGEILYTATFVRSNNEID